MNLAMCSRLAHEVRLLPAKGVNASVDVGVVVLVVVSYGVDDLVWLLGCRGVVKVDKRVAVDFALRMGKSWRSAWISIVTFSASGFILLESVFASSSSSSACFSSKVCSLGNHAGASTLFG